MKRVRTGERFTSFLRSLHMLRSLPTHAPFAHSLCFLNVPLHHASGLGSSGRSGTCSTSAVGRFGCGPAGRVGYRPYLPRRQRDCGHGERSRRRARSTSTSKRSRRSLVPRCGTHPTRRPTRYRWLIILLGAWPGAERCGGAQPGWAVRRAGRPSGRPHRQRRTHACLRQS